MNILCVDTSMGTCHAAFIQGDKVFEIKEEMRHGHAVRLVPLIEELLAKAGNSYDDVDVLAVTKGPGSFTGIRVGLATVSATGLALDKPVLGFSTLELMALPYQGQKVVTCIDTRCGDFFTQEFDEKGRAAGDILCLTKKDIDGTYPDHEKVFDAPLSASQWAVAVQGVLEKGDIGNYGTDPLYVKPPEAKKASYLPDIQWND